MNQKEVNQMDQDENERVQTALAETAFWQDRYRKAKSQLTIAQRIIGKSAADWRTKSQLRKQLGAAHGMIAELQAMLNWISVHERLPDDGQLVLVTHNGERGIGTYCAEDKELWLEQGTLWLPYPELP